MTEQDMELDWSEVYRRLSGKSTKRPSYRVVSQVERIYKEIRDLVRPATSHVIVDVGDLPVRPYFDGAVKVALAVCTIGDGLPTATNAMMQFGRLSDAIVVDAIGSVLADQLATQVNEIISQEARELELVPSLRYSPGYCDMDLEDQPLIFDIVSDIGVTLTESKMMIPLKSVSFVVNLGKKVINRCVTCDRRTACPHRRI